MKTIMLRSLLLLTVIGLTGCAGKSLVQKDERVNLLQYKTYQWLTQDDANYLDLEHPKFEYMSSSVRIVTKPAIADKLRPMIEANLDKQGYVPAQGTAPDFFVTFYGRAKDEDWVSTWEGTTAAINNVPVVMYPGLERPNLGEYRDGTLVVVVYDAKTRQPSWTGSIPDAYTREGVQEEKLTAQISNLISEFKVTV